MLYLCFESFVMSLRSSHGLSYYYFINLLTGNTDTIFILDT